MLCRGLGQPTVCERLDVERPKGGKADDERVDEPAEAAEKVLAECLWMAPMLEQDTREI